MSIDPRAYSNDRLKPPAPLPVVSRRALKRVKNPLPAPTACPYCQGPVELVLNAEIYGSSYGGWPYAYLCRPCDAYVGLHPATDIPLGTLADRKLRQARKEYKPLFMAVMRKHGMNRNEGYPWLADKMGIPVEQCHWGWFTLEQCEQAGRICTAALVNREGVRA